MSDSDIEMDAAPAPRQQLSRLAKKTEAPQRKAGKSKKAASDDDDSDSDAEVDDDSEQYEDNSEEEEASEEAEAPKRKALAMSKAPAHKPAPAEPAAAHKTLHKRHQSSALMRSSRIPRPRSSRSTSRRYQRSTCHVASAAKAKLPSTRA